MKRSAIRSSRGNLARRKRRRAVGIVAGAAGIAAAALAIAFGRGAVAPPFAAALVGLDERQIRAVSEAAAAFARAGGAPPRLAPTVATASLASALAASPKPDLVLFAPGAASRARSASFASPPENRRGIASSTVSAAVAAEGRLYATPLLIDCLELAWRNSDFERAKLAPPLDLAALEKAAAHFASKKPMVPLVAAGGDDALLIAIVGQLLANRSGVEAYDALAALAAKERDFGKLVEVRLPAASGGTTALRETLELLARWTKAGWLPAEWLRYDEATCRRLIEEGLVAMALQTLSFHRTIEYQAIYAYKTFPFLPFDRDQRRAIAAPILAAGIAAGSRNAEKAQAFLDYLTGEAGQALLAKGAGSAPAASAVRAPDVQAAAARAKAATSDRLLLGLDLDSGADRSALAAVIRDYIAAAARR